MLDHFSRRLHAYLSRAALATCIVGAAHGVQAQQIPVGVTAPMTGPLSLTGKSYVNALRMAEQDINAAGGINGRKVNLAFQDAQASNGTAINAFIKVVQEQKPDFVFLTSYSTQNVAVSPEVAKAQRPAMYAGGADIVAEQKNPWMFRIRPTDGLTAEAMARYAMDHLRAAKPGILYIQNDFGQGGAKAAEKTFAAANVKVVGAESYGQNDKDMSAQILSLKNKGADVILMFVYAQDGALLLRQLKTLGIAQPVVSSSAAFVPAAIQLVSADDLKGIYGVVDTVLTEQPAAQTFLKRFKAAYQIDADPYAAAYYDGAMIMADAMRKVGTDPVAVRDYLRKVQGFKGVAHTYSFDASGNGVHDVSVIKFAPGTKNMQLIQQITTK
ncbi:ABC transporter substrate-binding protein [Pandoraea sp. XJJ-1]|uniref:ABC transporter substrate-binding protein n=1 Tax=Pandoraea sp. XJJ-1 TaxID=3002643 RepID=UPI0022810008|nr:ABC transporter substrate-binding protein [Pandoraea sp. XJJ-1]WAL81271.1 ABC transporter substrate-binding protein [Pandoraea sp. XJJ-1]